VSREEHDAICWDKVQLLLTMIRHTFQCVPFTKTWLFHASTNSTQSACTTCRLVFPRVTSKDTVTFHIVRAFDWTTLTHYGVRSHAAKFSVHITARHATHMFADRTSLSHFLNILTSHGGWKQVERIVDMSVYGKQQLFYMPRATKAPRFDSGSQQFDMETVQNVLLPVNPVTGVQEWPVIIPSRKHLHLPLHEWTKFLVTTFHVGVKAKCFGSTQSNYSTWHDIINASFECWLHCSQASNSLWHCF
jgi:hypothetical protein